MFNRDTNEDDLDLECLAFSLGSNRESLAEEKRRLLLFKCGGFSEC